MKISEPNAFIRWLAYVHVHVYVHVGNLSSTSDTKQSSILPSTEYNYMRRSMMRFDEIDRQMSARARTYNTWCSSCQPNVNRSAEKQTDVLITVIFAIDKIT